MRVVAAGLGLLLGCFGLSLASAATPTPYADFKDRREPPPFRALSPSERELFDLGHAVFNTQWVAAGAPRAERRDGLGPVFNAASCDACHNNGARGQGPVDSGPVPVALVIQVSNAGGADPRYGHVLNTAAIEGFSAEASVRVEYDVRNGQYADGQPWQLRAPRYEIRKLRNGPLAPSTLIKPRLAPALFGVGLLEQVPETALRKTARPSRMDSGRFGWQGESPSLTDQTARALSREMGLRSRLIPVDDCGSQDLRCKGALAGGDPEVSDAFMSALLLFQRVLAVPRSAAQSDSASPAAALFETTGCAACHRPVLPVVGAGAISRIQPYTDLLLHDMGPGLADSDVSGKVINSRWRTAPLWGIAHSAREGATSKFLLHDGRARSIEEAILWHGGEAEAARTRYLLLTAERRSTLLNWVSQR